MVQLRSELRFEGSQLVVGSGALPKVAEVKIMPN